jgi:2-polyprenyl-3-methyl-5-hydroxy-6-metoxy-1,4-benzoquinol methylase
MTWYCPIHHGDLSQIPDGLRADCCGTVFPVIEGIPDLRVNQGAWVDFAADLDAARTLSTTVPPHDVAGSIRAVFARRPGWSRARIDRRTALSLGMADRMREEWQGWLVVAARQPGPLLDLGCGAGSFLSVAPAGIERIGIDVSMEWLVVAKRACAAAGVPVQFAAALAEALPLRSGSIGIVTALDVIEHVGDQAAMVREIDRVLQPDGLFCGATPNRFSVGAEPHVGVWGVGWLPRPLQARYVQWRTNLPYQFVRLLSHREIKALFRCHASFIPAVEPAPIPASDIARFGRRRQLLAASYNRMLAWGPTRAIAQQLGAFYHLVGRKPGSAAAVMSTLSAWAPMFGELLAI